MIQAVLRYGELRNRIPGEVEAESRQPARQRHRGQRDPVVRGGIRSSAALEDRRTETGVHPTPRPESSSRSSPPALPERPTLREGLSQSCRQLHPRRVRHPM